MNADWLFKCVGAANAVLSDPKERRELDADLAAQEGRAASTPAYSRSAYSYYPRAPSYYTAR